jgi:hypothetical protein
MKVYFTELAVVGKSTNLSVEIMIFKTKTIYLGKVLC